MRSVRKLSENLHKFMLWPAILLFTAFFVVPFVSGVGISLTRWNGLSKPTFVGLDNFVSFFADKRATHALGVTLLFGFISPILMNLFGMLYALLLDTRLKGTGIVRAIVYSPAVISSLIMGYIWLLLIKPETGALHQLFKLAGAASLYPDLLSTGGRALRTIILVNTWQYLGGNMIIYLAGLQTIPVEIREAAVVDGCSPVTVFFRVTLPLLIPSIKINLVLNLIGCLSVFDIIMALTSGGPGYATESMSIFIYRMCYGGNTGYATAVSLILFLVILAPVGAASWLLHKKEVSY